MGKFGIVPVRLLYEIFMRLRCVVCVQNHTGTTSEISASEMSNA
jgi:hypothetical protein